MRIVVLGGSGLLGQEVMDAVTGQGHEAVAHSRRTGVDIATGVGLDAALREADAVVHAADALAPWRWRSVTAGGTRNVAEAISRMPRPAHLVYISIIGVDRIPYPYYRAKHQAEMAIRARAIPATVVRTTQFHSLAAALASARIGPVGVGVKGFRIQPVDIRWVGSQLAGLAAGPSPTAFTRAPELAGPDLFTAEEISALVAEHRGLRVQRRLEMPALGAIARAFAAGAVLPGSSARLGGESFVQWLDRQPDRLPRR